MEERSKVMDDYLRTTKAGKGVEIVRNLSTTSCCYRVGERARENKEALPRVEEETNGDDSLISRSGEKVRKSRKMAERTGDLG